MVGRNGPEYQPKREWPAKWTRRRVLPRGSWRVLPITKITLGKCYISQLGLAELLWESFWAERVFIQECAIRGIRQVRQRRAVGQSGRLGREDTVVSTSNVPPPILRFGRSLETIALSPTATVPIVNCGEGSEPDRRWWVIPKGIFLIPQRLLYPIHQHQEIPSEDPRVRGCHLSCRSGRIAHCRIDHRSNFTPPDNRHHHPADHLRIDKWVSRPSARTSLVLVEALGKNPSHTQVQVRTQAASFR